MTDDRTATADRVVIERILAAPRHLVWRMWTEPEHFRAWYGPDGVTIPVAELDVRVGGRRLVCMEVATPDGPHRMWFTGEHLEVVDDERLVYTESMSDPDGNVLSPEAAGMPEGSPVTTQVTVELENNGERTRMVMTHAGVPEGSPGEAGWRMAFDKLAVAVRERTA